MSEETYPEASWRFFANTACAYFPCHAGADPKRFNCLFCFCPLYLLGADCGGAFTYTEDGVKDCSACIFPHLPKSYDAVVERLAKR